MAEVAAWRPASPAAALGLAVEYLSLKPAFASLAFGEWSRVLFYQVVREHYLFFVDPDQRLVGFLGWALTDARHAELWVRGRAALASEDCVEGDCVIVNAWAADNAEVNLFMRKAAASLFASRRTLYFKRRNAAGQERPARLTIPRHRRSREANP